MNPAANINKIPIKTNATLSLLVFRVPIKNWNNCTLKKTTSIENVNDFKITLVQDPLRFICSSYAHSYIFILS